MSEIKLKECNFCGKDEQSLNILIAGGGAFICDNCVSLCCHMITKALCERSEKFKSMGENIDKQNEETQNDK